MKSLFCVSAIALLCAVSLAQPCRAQWVKEGATAVIIDSPSLVGNSSVGIVGNFDTGATGVGARATSTTASPSSSASATATLRATMYG